MIPDKETDLLNEIRFLIGTADELIPQVIQLLHDLRVSVRRAYYLTARVGLEDSTYRSRGGGSGSGPRGSTR